MTTTLHVDVSSQETYNNSLCLNVQVPECPSASVAALECPRPMVLNQYNKLLKLIPPTFKTKNTLIISEHEFPRYVRFNVNTECTKEQKFDEHERMNSFACSLYC